MKLQEAGIIERWRKKYWIVSSECQVTEPLGTPIDPNAVLGIFLAVSAAVCLAIIFFALEILCAKYLCHP